MATKPPPRKWEPWAAGFLLVLYGANSTRADEMDPQAAAANDWFLILAIVWFITIFVRRQRYKNSIAESPTASFPPPVMTTPAPPTPPPGFPPDENQQLAPASLSISVEIPAMSENAAEREWSSRHGRLSLNNERLVFQSDSAGSKIYEYQVGKILSVDLNGLPATGSQWLVIEVSGSGPVRFKIPSKEAKAFLREMETAVAASRQAQ